MNTHFVELEFHGIHTMEPEGFTCAIFRWEEGNKILPVWLDQDDALKIQAYHAGFSPRRPTSHELLAEAFTRNGPWVSNLRIVSHFEGVYMASIITSEGEEFDARPSDVIMLSELLEVPISADEEILQQTAVFVNDENLEAYFGIVIDATAGDSDGFPESASGNAQADADFQQLMQSLGVTEDDLFIDTDQGTAPDDQDGNPGENR
ncbi:MAG: bifunctional nuclease family protein [Corynebacterium sp.]|uniref:bifunctional nuclease family protein n=1 Tax=uncultured Corynebacterium sp. TaxID=159447 RepID=UPI0017ECB2E4|nr:bifunctional nuclease family protein [uncultured Corynebacterium sp.]NLZ57183.1 bifunctional nuclease family protein [Corynebacterium sp.]